MTPRLLRTLPIRVRSYSTPPYLSRAHVPPSASSSSSSSGPSAPHVGPFPLPHSQLDRDYLISQQAKTWSQLKGPEKVGEVAKQTSSFFVVIAGAGLCGLVFWAVGSELFSENSPTRIFEDITRRLERDPGLNSILVGPFGFHGSTTSDRLRRNRRISHSLTHDPHSGLETLFIRFTVEGRPDPNAPTSAGVDGAAADESWLDWCKRWIGPLVWEDSHRPGNYHPSLSTDAEERARALERADAARREEDRRTKSWTGWAAGFVGNAFGGITRGVASGGAATREGADAPGGGGLFKRLRKPKLGEYSSGEVVAELQKDPRTNQFVYKQLFVALPDTASPSYYRHDIPTDVVVPPEDGAVQKGLDRLRVWQRSRTVVQ
ncbi:hypothetical protein JCM11491_005236 [Sporobolomyces phaffii]